MCQFASFVLTNDREFWSETTDSHEEIIRANKLHADGATGSNIARIELLPPREGDWGDLSAWTFKLDQDVLPKWATLKTLETRTRAAAARRFQNGYKVGGSLNLSGCTGLKALPQGLSVGGSLNLSGCTGLKELPQGLSVRGSLYLYGCTGLKALPQGLSVGGWLNLTGCTGLKELPQGLSVRGSLNLSGCTGLKALPQDLSVGGWLDLSGCTGLKVPKYLQAKVVR